MTWLNTLSRHYHAAAKYIKNHARLSKGQALIKKTAASIRLGANEIKYFFGTSEDIETMTIIEGELKEHIKKPLKIAVAVVLSALFVFAIWGIFAPLDSAAIGQGYVALSGNHKTIQHQEGGIIEEIHIKEGDKVNENDLLIKLNDTPAKARVQMALSQLRNEKAALIRLIAEKENQEALNFSDDLLDSNIPEVAEILKTQEDLFEIRTKTIKGQIGIFNQRILQHEELLKGLQSQESSMLSQVKLIQDELKNVQELYNRGLALQSRLLELRRAEQDLHGRIAELRSNIGHTNEAISETHLQLLNMQNEHSQQISAELREARVKIADLAEQYRAAIDVLDRTAIRAPNAGIITGLEYHTIGGVIAPGSKIMDIVPQDDKLIIEAKISPRDVQSVHVGLTARVQLSAYKARLVPRVNGIISYVSADKFYDPQNPMMQNYYLVKIEIPDEELTKINYDIKLYPGMPAEVFIVKGERSFLQYLLTPIIESFHRAFKEA